MRISVVLNSLPPGKFFILYCRQLIFFKIIFLEKFFQEYHLSAKQIGSDKMSGLIWIQYFCCNGYKEMTLVSNELKWDFLSKILDLSACLGRTDWFMITLSGKETLEKFQCKL